MCDLVALMKYTDVISIKISQNLKIFGWSEMRALANHYND